MSDVIDTPESGLRDDDRERQLLADLPLVATEIELSVAILQALHGATHAQMNGEELSMAEFGVVVLAMIERAAFRLEDAYDLASGGKRMDAFNVRAIFDHGKPSEEAMARFFGGANDEEISDA